MTTIDLASPLAKYVRPAERYDGVINRCRDLRRAIRGELGVSRDSAPSLDATLRAARDLARLTDLTSGGRYGLAAVDIASGEPLPLDHVIAHERGLRDEARR